MGDEQVTHKGSQLHLLGEQPPPDLIARMSTDRQVTPRTPPTFLVHTTEDASVPVENSLQYAAALAGVHFASVTSAFAGHEVCGVQDDWINGLVPWNPKASCAHAR